MDRNNAHNAPGSGFTGGQPPAAPDRQTDEDQQDVRRPSDTNALLLSGAPDPTWYQLPPQVPPVVAVTQDAPHQPAHGQGTLHRHNIQASRQDGQHMRPMSQTGHAQAQIHHGTNNRGMHRDPANQWQMSQQALNPGAMHGTGVHPQRPQQANNQGMNRNNMVAQPQVPQSTGGQANLAQGPSMSATARAEPVQSSPGTQAQSSPGAQANTPKGGKPPRDRTEHTQRQADIRQERSAQVKQNPDNRINSKWEDDEDIHMVRLYNAGAKATSEMSHFLNRTGTSITARKAHLVRKRRHPNRPDDTESLWDGLVATVAAADAVNPRISAAVRDSLDQYRARRRADEAPRVAAGETAQEAADEAADQPAQEADEQAAEDAVDEAADDDDEDA